MPIDLSNNRVMANNTNNTESAKLMWIKTGQPDFSECPL